jgi:acarbose 7IV-phosphotransferase
VFAALLDGAGLAAISTIGFARALLPLAVSRRVPVAVDLQAIGGVDDYHQDWLRAAEIVFCSAARLEVSAQRWVSSVFDRYPARIVAVGQADRGCLLAVRGGPARTIPARPAGRVVDTTGAGDALFAAFLHHVHAGQPPEAAIERAAVAAGIAVATRGAGPYPTQADIAAVLAAK